ncbi:T9SS type A sorting domain-containing protein [Dysgonomonas sp. ZJ279]|uniref:T9SS type A sorting domain-containing protein n=1 Tax=Dysgonomonas sp. ZJ279 TaxID=2709796 RepID=UPI0013E9CFF9|nr:T9SS type A sorting domain-containing protein [Dysgonomonas sp. ZJ279]
MRLRLLLIILLFIPFVAKGQEPSHKVTFYNKGAMYTAPTTRTSTSPIGRDKVIMLIDGSAEFASGSAVKMQNESAFGITGDFISNPVLASDSVFVDADKSGFQTGKVWFMNTNFDFLTSSVNVPVAISPAKEFAISVLPTPSTGSPISSYLKDKQVIKMNSTTRDVHHIAFPSIVVDSTSYVAVDPSAAVLVNGIVLNSGSWFTQEAKYNSANSRVLDIAYIKSRGAAGITKAVSNGVVSGYADNDYRTWYQGRSFLDLKLYNPVTLPGAGAPGSNQLSGDDGYMLTGFTPIQGRNMIGYPASGVRADHMFFNTLLDPKPWSLTGSTGPVVDPKFDMKPGKGYFMAQDVTSFDFDLIEDNHSLPGGTDGYRAVGGYQFNRALLTQVRYGFNQFPATANSASGAISPTDVNNWTDYRESFLNIESAVSPMVASYTVDLTKGLNFLGNPYGAPLDLSDIINVAASVGTDTPTSLPDWGVTVSDNNTAADIRNKYWIVGDGRIRYKLEGGKHYFQYKVSYWDSPSGGIGGTLLGLDAVGNSVNIGADNGLVAPMQMFALQASKNVTITLPNKKTKFGNPTLRKAVAEKVDEILLQSIVLGDNNENLMEDRMTIVLRENATLGSNDNTDSRKGIVNARGSAEHGQGGQLTDNGEDPALNYSGIIYTRSSEGVPMLTNTIPTTTKQIAVYYTPTQTTQRVRIKPFRMESLQSVQRAWLVDRFENNKEIELTPETEYVFTSKPLTGEQAKENRFILYFDKKPNEIIVDEVLPISVYYNSSIIYIDGLNDGDMNSLVQIYDLQGRLMGKTTVTNTPSMQYMKILSQGTYIIKITGKRNFTTKFITLQN